MTPQEFIYSAEEGIRRFLPYEQGYPQYISLLKITPRTGSYVRMACNVKQYQEKN